MQSEYEMRHSFKPDLVISSGHLLIPHCTVYMDGLRVELCWEIRAKWDSFKEPTFGKIVIASTHKPNPRGFVVREGVTVGMIPKEDAWVVYGKLLIDLDEDGKHLLAQNAH